jgi:hypothetical protein
MAFALLNSHQRLIKAPINELDKATIVSILPFKFDDKKDTLSPGRFIIEAAKDGDFSILVIGSSSWWKELEDGQPWLEIPHSSIQMAQSVITDFCNGLFCCDMGDKMPGLFFVPGEFTKKTILTYIDSKTGQTFLEKLEKARQQQKNWYAELVRQADIMWSRSGGNPIAIDDHARLAADKLGLIKVWMQDFKSVQMINCKACGQMVNPAYPVCPTCKAIIDAKRAEELGITFAK